jgi:N-methylhydantoinase B
VSLDPIRLEVLRNALQSCAEEMGAALARTAYTVNIRDRRDFSCGVYTTDGALVAQAEHIPLHLGLMPSVVKAVLRTMPLERLQPGDVLVTNDSFVTGTHLMDICVVTPVFAGSRPIGIVASMAHHADVGGFAPGSAALGVSEIHQEGFRMPPVRLQDGGALNRDMLRIFAANSRTPDDLTGDLLAQLSSNHVGSRRLVELWERYAGDLPRYLEGLIDYTERRLRAALDMMPAGRFAFEEVIEGDGFSEDAIPIRVAVSRRGDRLHVDFTGTSPQVRGPLNAAKPGALACVYFVVKAVFDPDGPSNEGIARVVDVEAPEGTLVNARYPAAVALFNSVSSQKVTDALLGAFLQAVPHRVPAASTGSMNALIVGGVDTRTGRPYTYVETYGGGQGALHDCDGADGTHVNMTNTRNTSVEALEIAYPLRVHEYSLVPDSGGAGRRRGGVGLRRVLETLSNGTTVTIHTDRRERGAWGVDGGEAGGCSRCTMQPPAGASVLLPSKATVRVPRGTIVCLETAGGGGWGPPRERDRDAVARDVRDLLVSAERAHRVYGVRDDP